MQQLQTWPVMLLLPGIFGLVKEVSEVKTPLSTQKINKLSTKISGGDLIRKKIRQELIDLYHSLA